MPGANEEKLLVFMAWCIPMGSWRQETVRRELEQIWLSLVGSEMERQEKARELEPDGSSLTILDQWLSKLYFGLLDWWPQAAI